MTVQPEPTSFPSVSPHRSRIRSRIHTPVELILNDGTQLSGFLFIGTEQRVLDMLNEAPAFIAFKTQDQEIMLLAKAAIAVCKPLEPAASA